MKFIKRLTLVLGIMCIIGIHQSQTTSSPIHQVKAAPIKTQLNRLDKTAKGDNLKDCVSKIETGGWCEITDGSKAASIASVWPQKLPKRIRMNTGQSSVLTAWNSGVLDQENQLMYFLGGGHEDYGGNEVYQYDLNHGQWQRLSNPSPLTSLFVYRRADRNKKKPWRSLCWRPSPELPGSSHTYDGLHFKESTKTIIYFSQRAANGSCIEDKQGRYDKSELVVNSDIGSGYGLYEFNPSKTQTRNGIKPLQWRVLINRAQFKTLGLHTSMPRMAGLENGKLAVGTRTETIVIDPDNIKIKPTGYLTRQSDFGDGLMIGDLENKMLWSLHRQWLFGFDSNTGRKRHKIKMNVPHGKSLAIDKRGKLFTWNGRKVVSTIDTKNVSTGWDSINWGMYGPYLGDGRVYGKWRYLSKHDVFIGVVTHKTGVWVYKHPVKTQQLPVGVERIKYSHLNPQKIIDRAKAEATVAIPKGTYRHGLVVNKSLDLDLSGVDLRGIARGRAMVNVKCNDCKVTIRHFTANGFNARCQKGSCAAIKLEGKNPSLTVLDSHLEQTVMGILTDNRGGQVAIKRVTIKNTGKNDNSSSLAHGFYAGLIDKVTIEDSTISDVYGNGHVVKSRALSTQINNTNIIGGSTPYSRLIDYACGGDLTVTNSTLHHGENTDNSDMISVGVEKGACHHVKRPSSLTFTNNWLVIDRDCSQDERAATYGVNQLVNWKVPVKSIRVEDNSIVETTGQLIFNPKIDIGELSKNNKIFSTRQGAGLSKILLPLRTWQ